MDERRDIPETEKEEQKSVWQQTKESWYDKIPLSLKQLDMIVVACWVALGLTAVAIALDALDIWHLFG